MKHTIKAPTTVRELGEIAEKLDMDLMEAWDLLDSALGQKWWNRDNEVFTVVVAPDSAGLNRFTEDEIRAELDRRGVEAPTPPAGYVLAEGCSDHFIGHEIVKRGWIITPAWNATTNTHSLELWTANHEPPLYANLSLADAFDLAADLITAARTVESAGNTEPDTEEGTD